MQNVTKKLESLSAEQQEFILDLSANAQRLADVVSELWKHGIVVSLSTLTRFVREHRAKVALAEGENMKGAVDALAAQGESGGVRKGTLEAIRQRFFEEALSKHGTTEETLKVYGELLKEEAKFKELQLAERRMAVMEEQTRLQKVKLRLAARELRGRKMVKLEGANVVQNAEVAELEERSREGAAEGPKRKEIGQGAAGGGQQQMLGTESGEKVKALAGVVSRLDEILNRGGSVEDTVMEARGVLAEERKLLEAVKTEVT